MTTAISLCRRLLSVRNVCYT